MAEINLAPGAQYIAVARKRRRVLFSLSALIILAVVVAVVGLSIYKQKSLQELQKATADLSAIKTQIARLGTDSDRVGLFEKRLTAIDLIMKNRISWNPVFADLEKLLPASTVITYFKANVGSKTIEMNGITPGIDEVAQTFASLVKKQNHSTMFSSGYINGVQERLVAGTADAPTSRTYSFSSNLIMVDK